MAEGGWGGYSASTAGQCGALTLPPATDPLQAEGIFLEIGWRLHYDGPILTALSAGESCGLVRRAV
jgi:hypothetical protein